MNDGVYGAARPPQGGFIMRTRGILPLGKLLSRNGQGGLEDAGATL